MIRALGTTHHASVALRATASTLWGMGTGAMKATSGLIWEW